MADTGATSVSLTGTAGGASLEIGDVGSFLKRLPKIEFLLVGFVGGVSEVGLVAEASLVTGLNVSSAAIALFPSKGITGSATAREAISCQQAFPNSIT